MLLLLVLIGITLTLGQQEATQQHVQQEDEPGYCVSHHDTVSFVMVVVIVVIIVIITTIVTVIVIGMIAIVIIVEDETYAWVAGKPPAACGARK